MHRLIENYVAEATQTMQMRQTLRPLDAPVAVETGLQGEELRQHLHELMQAHQELGLDEAGAAEAAIAQFGSAKTVRRGLMRTSLRGAVRSRAFWQAAVLATMAQVTLNLAGNALLGWSGKVDATALVQLYSDRQIGLVFALTWIFQLCVVGKLTARLCPRYAPLAASLYAAYQAVYFAVDYFDQLAKLFQLSAFYTCTTILLIAAPPAIYALFAWGFVRRDIARKMRRA